MPGRLPLPHRSGVKSQRDSGPHAAVVVQAAPLGATAGTLPRHPPAASARTNIATTVAALTSSSLPRIDEAAAAWLRWRRRLHAAQQPGPRVGGIDDAVELRDRRHVERLAALVGRRDRALEGG